MDDLDLFSVFETSTTQPNAAVVVSEVQAGSADPPVLPKKRFLEGDANDTTGKKKKARTEEAEEVEESKTTKVAPIREEWMTMQVILGEDDPSKRALHEVVLPAGYVAPEHPTSHAVPAKVYPFKLDPFQAKSIECLEAGESVLVSAHTSAGKTAVAEYAVAMALRNKSRVIYTSPIKALSNQKYRDLAEEFSDVGLMTGDVTINPNATALVMTTEILRSMLYRGSEILREVAWVVYDEIHYMRDKERGVVWEESIIMLPHKVRFVFLSATIPNAKEFISWVAHVHKQKCHVIYTEYRPTPLQHYIFPSGGDGLHLVVDEKGKFREDNFQKAMSGIANTQLEAQIAESSKEGKIKKKDRKKAGSDLQRIIKMVMERNYDPVIVFSFSKKDCEAYGVQMSKLDFNTDDEKKLIEQVYYNAIDSLSEDDRKLPQVNDILPLLKCGIGIHHGGLLPILKEVIEILFQESLIKCLFATETFSMGINMPAKTVVFTSARKFDGADYRFISPGEYIQMSGRAGRRGLDDRGIVIQMVDEKMEPEVAKGMLKGHTDPLNSTFHLGYNMLLNLLRVEDADPEYMIGMSFYQYQQQAKAPKLQEHLNEIEAGLAALVVPNESHIEDYYNLNRQADKFRFEMRGYLTKPATIIPFLQPGRLIRMVDNASDWGWGVMINFQKAASSSNDKSNAQNSGDAGDVAPTSYIVDVLVYCEKLPSDNSVVKPRPGPRDASGKCASGGVMQVVPFLLSVVDSVSSLRVYVPKDLKSEKERESLKKTIAEVERRFPQGIPLLDPIEDMQINDPEFIKLASRCEKLKSRISELGYAGGSADNHKLSFDAYVEKIELENRKKDLTKQMKQSETLILKDQLKRMMRLLRRLGFTNEENVVQLKGRVACEVNTADELVVTELMFNGAFNELSIEQTVALLSCFVYDVRKEEPPKLKEELAGKVPTIFTYSAADSRLCAAPLRVLQETATKVAKLSNECKLEVDEKEYVGRFKVGLMETVYAWAKGAKFSEICKMTEEFEGSIIRVIRRLEELLRQLAQAAKVIGNTALEEKFLAGTEKIKRDIVFAASLYL